MKTILITGIGGLTPRSIAKVIRKNHPDYKLIGCDIDKKAMGFFMPGLLDEHYVCPRCNEKNYFPWIEKLIKENLKVRLLNGVIITKNMVNILVLSLWEANFYQCH